MRQIEDRGLWIEERGRGLKGVLEAMDGTERGGGFHPPCQNFKTAWRLKIAATEGRKAAGRMPRHHEPARMTLDLRLVSRHHNPP